MTSVSHVPHHQVTLTYSNHIQESTVSQNKYLNDIIASPYGVIETSVEAGFHQKFSKLNLTHDRSQLAMPISVEQG